MPRTKSIAATFCAAAFLLAGCGGDDTSPLWPTLDGAPPTQPTSDTTTIFDSAPAPTTGQPVSLDEGFGVAPTATAPTPIAQPVASAPVFAPTGTTAAATGTHVGLRIADLRQDLARLQNSIAVNRNSYEGLKPRVGQNAAQYQAHVAPIYARLQVGTTPGNPVLVQQWNEAELRLDRVNDDIDQLNALGNNVAADAALTSHLLEAVRSTYTLTGAYEEDHRQLALLEDEVNRTVIDVDRLLSQISTDISRQGNFVAAERANLTALALAIKTGSFFESPIRGAGGTAGLVGQGSPVAVIQFDRGNLNYEPQLRAAVQQVRAGNPNAAFDVVAVSAQGQDPASARSRAERVYRSMTRLGVSAGNLSLSAVSGNSGTDEVHVYTR